MKSAVLIICTVLLFTACGIIGGGLYVSESNTLKYCYADVNADNKEELVLLTVSDTETPYGTAGDRLYILAAGKGLYGRHDIISAFDVSGMKPLNVLAGDVNRDGINEVSLKVYKTAEYDPNPAQRPFFFNVSMGKLQAVWLGSRLARPFVDYTLADLDGDGQVNSIDLALLLAGYGKSSITVSPPPPVPGSDVLLASAGTKIICVCGETQWNPAIDCIDGRTGKDSSLGNKWCCVPDRPDENYKYTTHPQPLAADYPHFIVFDMGYEKSFDKYHINNAGTAMGEDKASNTKEWSMWVSDDNVTYVKVDEVTGNTADTYDKTFASPIKARYIKFIIPVADQFPSPPPVGTVRIYNINVYASAVEGTFPPGQAVSLN